MYFVIRRIVQANIIHNCSETQNCGIIGFLFFIDFSYDYFLFKFNNNCLMLIEKTVQVI